MYKYLFGPVPSRRLGMSLGIDLVPEKVCSLNCVYCEVGNTTKLTTDRKEYILYDKIKAELSDYFQNNSDPDYITFSGYGEPTLNVKFGEILRYIKKIKPHIPVAILTNGTLFYDHSLQEEIKTADVVLPSLDAATEEVFQKLNRPADGLSLTNYINGLIEFSRNFKGKIWLEVFILPGYNDHQEELEKLKNIIREINPDSIQLNTLDRPGTEPGLRGARPEELQKIKDFWDLENVKIISAAATRKNTTSYRKDTESVILETIARRPCTLQDLTQTLGMHSNEINKYLDVLEKKEKIQSQELDRGVFFQVTKKKQ